MRTPKKPHGRPFDVLFAAPSHIVVLRALGEWPEGLNGRELSRVANITHQTGRLATARLDKLGVIRTVGAGRSRRMTLDEGNDLVQTALLPLLAAERKLIAKADRRRREEFLSRAKTIMGKAS